MMIPIFVVEKGYTVLPDIPAAVVVSCIHTTSVSCKVLRFLQVAALSLILPVVPQSLGREMTHVQRRVVKDENPQPRIC